MFGENQTTKANNLDSNINLNIENNKNIFV